MDRLYKISLAITFVLLLHSCDNAPSVEPGLSDEDPCRVTEMSLDSELIIIKYDNDFKIDSILSYKENELIRYTFIEYINDYTVDTYSSRVSLVDDAMVPHDLPDRLEFDVQGRLVKHSFMGNTIGSQEVEPYVNDFDTLIYDGSGKLVEVQHWNSEEGPGQPYKLISVSTVVMNNSFNIVSVNYKDLRWGDDINYYYTYDDKKRITDDPILLNILYSGGDYIDGEYFSKNNILSRKSDDEGEDTYSYTYREDGRPLSITEFGETITVKYKGCD